MCFLSLCHPYGRAVKTFRLLSSILLRSMPAGWVSKSTAFPRKRCRNLPRTRGPATFARLSSRPGGLSPVPTERLHVWESRGPLFTSACKSLASHVPGKISFLPSRVEPTRGSTLQSINLVDELVIGPTGAHLFERPKSEAV